MNDKDTTTIRKMIQYCNDVDFLMQRYHSDFECYRRDISFQYSCNMCIIQLGELVNRLSDELQEQHPEIPWHGIRGMRNLHAHDYDRVDFSIVWTTLCEELRALRLQLEDILDQ